MKRILLSCLIILIINCEVYTQTEVLYMPDDSIKEYSGITRWKDYIILVPQKPTDEKLYAFTSTDLQNAFKDSSNGTTKNAITAQQIITHNMPAFEDGFEAAAIINDDIYITIETGDADNFCYVVKGRLAIENNEININFTGEKIQLPKPKNAHNMGFESLTYIKEKDSLLADFEFNKYTDKPTAFLIDKSLTAYSPVAYDSSLFFRVTDINETDSSTMLAVNHYYNDSRKLAEKDSNRCEYRIYEIENNETAKQQMHNADPTKTSFTRILELRLNDDKISWKEKTVVSYTDDNWEGILPFANGALMIVDGNRMVKCKLIYIPLN